jgi:hypothetical protein
MPATIALDLSAHPAATITVSDGEEGCLNAVYLCDAFHGQLRSERFYLQDGYTVPEEFCLPATICLRPVAYYTCSSDGFSNETDQTWDSTETYLEWLRDETETFYLNLPVDLSGNPIEAGTVLDSCRLVLEHISGGISDDRIALFLLDAEPADVSEVTGDPISPAQKRTVSDDRLTFDVRGKVQELLNDLAEGENLSALYFVLRIEPDGDSGASIRFHSSRTATEGKRGPYVRVLF